MGLSISNPSTSVTVTPNRLIMKADTSGQTTLQATGVTTGTGTTAGSYVQVSASTAAEYLLVGIDVHETSAPAGTPITDDGPVLVDIAVGAAASEVVQATVPISTSFYNGSSLFLTGSANLPIPLRISSSKRVAVRAKKSAANNANAIASLVVTLLLVPYANVEGN